MGYIRHHTIVVTGYSKEDTESIRQKAISIFGKHFLKEGIEYKGEELVSEIVYSAINGYTSFFIAPDGSKEGWETSKNGDSARAELIEILNKSNLSYVELYFGDDEGNSEVLSHN